MKTKKPNRVTEMVRDLSENGEFADQFEKRLAQRQLVKRLMVFRASKGISQKEIAEKMQCTQSRISELESSDDADLSLGDLTKYLSALGLEMTIVLSPKDLKAIDRVKYHAFAIKKLTDQLADLAGNDPGLIKAVKDFFGEAAFNLIRNLMESVKRLPPVEEEDGSFEIELIDEQSLTEEDKKETACR